MTGVRRWLPLLAVLALLGGAMFAAVYANPNISTLPVTPRSQGTVPPQDDNTQPPPSADPRASLEPPRTGATVPIWVTWLLTGLCVAAIIAVVVSLLWMTLRDRLVDRKYARAAPEDDEAARLAIQARVRAAVDEGLTDLDDDETDPRRAVIACWVRLEQAAAAAGTAREIGDTSTDLVARLLSRHDISAGVLAELAEVYREARFATHAVDITMRERARSALRRIRDELVASVPRGRAEDQR